MSEVTTRLLDEARAAVSARGGVYRPPAINFGQIAERWSLHLSQRLGYAVPVSASDVADMMEQLKEVRSLADPTHWDSLVDRVGYLICAAEIRFGENECGND